MIRPYLYLSCFLPVADKPRSIDGPVPLPTWGKNDRPPIWSTSTFKTTQVDKSSFPIYTLPSLSIPPLPLGAIKGRQIKITCIAGFGLTGWIINNSGAGISIFLAWVRKIFLVYISFKTLSAQLAQFALSALSSHQKQKQKQNTNSTHANRTDIPAPFSYLKCLGHDFIGRKSFAAGNVSVFTVFIAALGLAENFSSR